MARDIDPNGPGVTFERETDSSTNPENRGIGKKPISEITPVFAKRDNDHVIEGKNNTWIVLGTDRTPRPDQDPNQADFFGGYGGRGAQNAGAIDIVVGRLAPVVVPGYESVDPVFGQVPVSEPHQINSGQRPPWQLDAARIYISQKTDIDAAFQLSPGLTNPSPPSIHDSKRKAPPSPRSAIGMHADEIRLVSRQGIKLVTGQHHKGAVNSLGSEVQATYGIDLIAGNAQGKASQPEPLVKGYKLEVALSELVSLVRDITGVVSTLFQVQFGYNIAIGTHWHPEPALMGIPGMPSPVLAKKAMPILIVESMQKLITSLVNHEINLSYYEFNYLTPATEGYINSSFNSTN